MGGRRLALERGGVLEPGVLRPTTTALRLADMDRDGVDATVMYGPIVPLLIEDPELRKVCYRAYNDWLAEFCATAPARLIGVGLIPIDDPQERGGRSALPASEIGLRTCMLLAARVETPLWDDAWEPLWAGGGRDRHPDRLSPGRRAAHGRVQRTQGHATREHGRARRRPRRCRWTRRSRPSSSRGRWSAIRI